jgi:hypothetical protein
MARYRKSTFSRLNFTRLFGHSASYWSDSESPFKAQVPVNTSGPPWHLMRCAALIVVIALSGCQAAGLIHDGAIDEGAVDRIAREAQKAATIQYLRPVRARVVTLAMAQKFANDAAVDEFGGKETLRALSQIEVDLEIADLPAGCQCDPKGYLDSARRSFVSELMAAYEIAPDSVAIVEGGDERFNLLLQQQLSFRQKAVNLLSSFTTRPAQRAFSEDVTLGVFAGALLDQHFGTSDAIRHTKGNHDEMVALAAVRDGETSLISDAARKTNYDVAAACNSLGKQTSWKQLLSVLYGLPPPWLSLAQNAAYLKEKFVCEAYKRDGWAGVNGLYRIPPRSMQQILDPTLYYEHPLLPMRVILAGYEDRLEDWTKISEDTYGETWLQSLLVSTVNNPNEAQVAAQWAGDRMVLLEKDDRVGAIWLIVFRDKLAATTFYRQYRPPSILSTGDEVRTAVKNESVLIAVGDVAKDLEQLAPAIWNKTRIRGSDGKERQP